MLENVSVDYQPREERDHRFNWKKAEKETLELMAQLGCNFSVHSPVKALSLADQQLVDMVAALRKNLKLLIVDEPTASLTPPEVERLFKILRKLNSEGVPIIFIGHRLDEVLSISDRITVLKDGEIVTVKKTSEMNEDELVRLMVGRNIVRGERGHVSESTAVRLSVNNLSSPGFVVDASFDVQQGEILGIGGLVGAGRSELLETVFGLRHRTSGTVVSEGKYEINSVQQAIEAGIALVPEDRAHNGLCLNRSVGENLVVSNLKKTSKKGTRSFPKELILSMDLVKKFQIKVFETTQLVLELSGGNQQKVSLAKWLSQDLNVLLIDEPSRGVDVGSKSEIHELINKSAESGMSVIMVSSDMRELVELSHRILVMRNGRIVGELKRDEISEERVLRLGSGLTVDSAGGKK